MHTPVSSPRSWSLDGLPADERQRVLDMARVLEQAARSGHVVQTLRGKNLAVLCESAECPGLDNFRRAAAALGARVTQVRPSEALTDSVHGPDAVGSLLGRLYDAIDCHGVSPEVVDWLARTTGKPVFNDLACQGEALASRAPVPEYTLQSLLLSALA
jgi:ornithine carbamoyltransferase